LAPFGVSGYTVRGEEKSKHNDFVGALADFNTAIAEDPQNVRALIDRAGTKNAMGDYQGALLNLNEIIKIAPENSTAWYMRSYAKRQLHDMEGCNSDLQEGGKVRAAYAEKLYDEGLRWLDDGDDDQALYAFNEAIKIAPNLTKCYNGRAFIECKMKEFDLAIADLYSVSNLPAVWVVQAWLLTKKDDLYGAMSLYNQAIGVSPKSAPLYLDRSNTWSALGDFDKAISDLDEAIEIEPSGAIYFNARGKAKVKIRDIHGALADFERAVELDPRLDEARANMRLAQNSAHQ
jgi:tetratricopeptide (TPR) repeat protein